MRYEFNETKGYHVYAAAIAKRLDIRKAHEKLKIK